MDVSVGLWLVTVAIFVVVIVLDLLIADRRPHVLSIRESVSWIAFYVGLAAIFAVLVGWLTGWQYAQQFVGGYLTEFSLSVDNLFVFLVLLTSFAVPEELRHRILMLGIVIALILRFGLIVLGAAIIERFSAVFFIFGAFLLWTAAQVYRHRSDTPTVRENPLFRAVTRVIPTTEAYSGSRFFVRQGGELLATPLFVVILAIGTTDLLFALDSIPAIFGLTEEPFIVFTANAFALLGLRQLFFLISGLARRLVYLPFGLTFILGFIGVKLLLHAVHETFPQAQVPEIPVTVSLAVIVGALAVTVVASLQSSRHLRAGEQER